MRRSCLLLEKASHIFANEVGYAVRLYTETGLDPEILLPGGTEGRSLEPSGESREVGGEYEWGMNPFSLGGSRASPGNFFKISVSENAFQAILKPIFPYPITSILSKIRHSNTLFFAINFSFPCHPQGCAILLWHSLGLPNNFLKFFD